MWPIFYLRGSGRNDLGQRQDPDGQDHQESAMIGLGAISYSLYLCHWPVIFFGQFIFGEVPTASPGFW